MLMVAREYLLFINNMKQFLSISLIVWFYFRTGLLCANAQPSSGPYPTPITSGGVNFLVGTTFSISSFSPTNQYFVTNCPDSTFNGLYNTLYITNNIGLLINVNSRYMVLYPTSGGFGATLQSNSIYALDGSQIWYDAVGSPIPVIGCEDKSANPLATMAILGVMPTIASLTISNGAVFGNINIISDTNSSMTTSSDSGARNFRMQFDTSMPQIGLGMNIGNVVFRKDGVIVYGFEPKNQTNGAINYGYLQEYVLLDGAWAARVGGPFLHTIRISSLGQSMFGIPEMYYGYNGVDSSMQIAPAFLSSFAQRATSNAWAFFMQPGGTPTTVQSGCMGNDGTNLFCVLTNSAGKTVTSKVFTSDDMTNGLYAPNGPTNATAPASAVVIKAWVNFTNSSGGVFKLPLYQ